MMYFPAFEQEDIWLTLIVNGVEISFPFSASANWSRVLGVETDLKDSGVLSPYRPLSTRKGGSYYVGTIDAGVSVIPAAELEPPIERLLIDDSPWPTIRGTADEAEVLRRQFQRLQPIMCDTDFTSFGNEISPRLQMMIWQAFEARFSSTYENAGSSSIDDLD